MDNYTEYNGDSQSGEYTKPLKKSKRKKKLKIIAFEGLDKTGKYTQSCLLEDYLSLLGKNVVIERFPRYKTEVGKKIKAMLDGTTHFDKYEFELLMSLDKQSFQKEIKRIEDDRGIDFLILDRYTLSQKVYALASEFDEEFVNQLQRFMRKPDATVYIDISPEESIKRKGKNEKNDVYEKDINFLKKVRGEYYKHKQNLQNTGEVISVNGTQDIVTIARQIREELKNWQ